MAICGLSHCDYVVEKNYNPQYGLLMEDDSVKGSDRAETIFKNCLALAFKESFYVGTDGVLEGYSWFNLPGRIFLWICNWYSGGRMYADAIIKIEETFDFILGIRNEFFSHSFNDREDGLSCTSFNYSLKFYCPYTSLAEKVIKKYPCDTHQKLYRLAHRILHERPVWIQVERDGHLTERRNIAREAKGSPYERTTVWGD